MRTKTIVEELKASKEAQDNEGVAFEIDPEALEHIMGVLTNLYSDVKTAVFREYLSNAIDSHIRAETSEPVLITLPQHGNGYNLTIADSGVGMSEEEINKIYRKYGSSTKSTDNGLIGGFGLGGKSALALSDSFSGVSVKDGQKTVFSVKKRSDNLPHLIVDSVTETDDANGMKVTIPYGASFNETEIPRLVSGFPVGSVKFVNSSVKFRSIYDRKLYFTLKNLQGNILGWYSSNVLETKLDTVVHVSIGGVLYPIEYSDIPMEFAELKTITKKLNESKIVKVVNVPVGSVKFTPSRENLVYNEQTVNTLTQIFTEFMLAMETTLQARLNSECSDRAEAVKFVLKWNSAFKNHFWRGEQVITHIPTSKEPGTFYIHRSQKSIAVSGMELSGQLADEAFSEYSRRFSYNVKRMILVHDDKDFNHRRYISEYYKGLVSRKFRLIEEYFGVKEIVLIPKEIADNPWFAHYATNRRITFSAFLEELATVHQAKLKELRELRKKENVAPVVKKPVKFRYRVLEFNKDNYAAVQVDIGDKVLENKKIAYITENSRYSGLSLSSNIPILSAKYSVYMRLMQEKYAGYTIFVVSNRQDIEKFKETYPQSVHINNQIIDVAVERFTEELSKKEKVTLSEIYGYLSHTDKYGLQVLLQRYNSFIAESDIRIEELDEMVADFYGTSFKPKPLTKYDDLVSRPIREEQMKPYVSSSKEILSKYKFLEHLLGYPNWKQELQNIEKVISMMY